MRRIGWSIDTLNIKNPLNKSCNKQQTNFSACQKGKSQQKKTRHYNKYPKKKKKKIDYTCKIQFPVTRSHTECTLDRMHIRQLNVCQLGNLTLGTT